MTALPGSGAMGIHCIMAMQLVLVVLWAGVSGVVGGAEEMSNAAEGAGSFEMELVYRYSDEFRELAKGRPGWEHVAWQEWPSKGTAEFYEELVMKDRHRHGAASRSRNLQSSTADVYALSPNATTFYLPPLGSIHYTFISLGTPAKTFLVGLDTGSDLLWVPCDCQHCSLANWTAYGLEVTGDVFSIYSPSNSSTSKAVPCNNEICSDTLSPSACDVAAPQSCTYEINYLSPNTSSSGKIVQDVISLFQENKSDPQATYNIYFGCGTTQTGDFLTGGAPDGLFGLGPQAYSIPVTLGRSGLIQNVFSMCFIDPLGKLVFGRKPATSLQSTPLIPTTTNVFYVLGVERIVAGGVSLKAAGGVVFDTGTSFTQFPSNVTKAVGDAIASTTTLKTWTLSSSSLQLDYCWNATTDAELDSLSSLSFVFGGGGTWKIIDPLLLFGSNGILEFACLGMVTGDVPIIGYNFMSQYEYFFDLDTSTFSWGLSNCSSSYNLNTIDIAPASAPSPSMQSPMASSGPSTSPPTAREPPPGTPPIGGPAVSKAYRSSHQHTPFQVLYLAILSMFFHLIACKMS